MGGDGEVLYRTPRERILYCVRVLQRYKAAPESIFYIIHMIPQSQFLVLVVLVSPPLFLPTQHSPYAQKPQARKQYKAPVLARGPLSQLHGSFAQPWGVEHLPPFPRLLRIVGGVTFFAAPQHAPLVTPQVLPVLDHLAIVSTAMVSARGTRDHLGACSRCASTRRAF